MFIYQESNPTLRFEKKHFLFLVVKKKQVKSGAYFSKKFSDIYINT